MTREELQTGAKVKVISPYSKRESEIEGTVKSWRDSRFGGVFVDIEAVTSFAILHNGYCQCGECRDTKGRTKERKMLLTYAMTDLVLI